MKPLVSIGMPLYNGSRYLHLALESILAQTFGDFELIISDNASTDDSGEIARRYANADARIRYVRQPVNRGAAWNYNHVIRLASGRYFRHAAHDDLLAPTNLERCVDALERDPGVVLAYPRMVIIDAEGTPTETRQGSLELDDERASRRLARFAALIDENAMCDPVFGLMRMSALQRTALLGSYISADMILLAEFALNGRIVEVPEYLFFERLHANGSVQANPTLDDRAAWFDHANRGKLINHAPFYRWLAELIAAIARAPLPPRERLACFVAVRHWLWHNKRGLVEDLGRVALRLAARPAHAP